MKTKMTIKREFQPRRKPQRTLVKQMLKSKKKLRRKKWTNKNQLIFKKRLNLIPMTNLLQRLQLSRKTILLKTKKKTIILSQHKSRTQLRKTLVKLMLKRK